MSEAARLLVLNFAVVIILCLAFRHTLISSHMFLNHLVCQGDARRSPADAFDAGQLYAVPYPKRISAVARDHRLLANVHDNMPVIIRYNWPSAYAWPRMSSYAFHGVDGRDHIPCLLDGRLLASYFYVGVIENLAERCFEGAFCARHIEVIAYAKSCLELA